MNVPIRFFARILRMRSVTAWPFPFIPPERWPPAPPGSNDPKTQPGDRAARPDGSRNDSASGNTNGPPEKERPRRISLVLVGEDLGFWPDAGSEPQPQGEDPREETHDEGDGERWGPPLQAGVVAQQLVADVRVDVPGGRL